MSKIDDQVLKIVTDSRDLAGVIKELMEDKDFPNDPVWIARVLLSEYDIKPKKKPPT